MSPRRRSNPDDPGSFLPLKPRVFLMLLVLAQGQRHGYALKEELLRRTDGRLNLGPGTLYRTIHGLLEDGLIAESDERPEPQSDDERRRYYHVTDLGRRVASAEAARLSELVDLARTEGLLS